MPPPDPLPFCWATLSTSLSPGLGIHLYSSFSFYFTTSMPVCVTEVIFPSLFHSALCLFKKDTATDLMFTRLLLLPGILIHANDEHKIRWTELARRSAPVNTNQASHLKQYAQNKLTCRLANSPVCVCRTCTYLCLIHSKKETEERKNPETTSQSHPLQNIVSK